MACLYTLLVLLVLAFFAGPWVLLGLQYRRQREHAARVADVERELGKLRALFEQRIRAATAAPPIDTAAPSKLAATSEIASPIEVASPIGVAPIETMPPVPPRPGAPARAPLPAAMAAASAAAATAAAPSIGASEIPLSAPPISPPAGAPPPPPSPPRGAGAAPPAGGSRAPAIDWERWIGVRGAAVLGGIVLALAGILFVRYSIERGLISPTLRVAMGILFGLGAIAWSLRLRARGYRINADALAGAGIVLLYAALWAAHSLYGFIGAVPAYALMSLVTVACGVLSWRSASMLIAVLGLVGGFATPFLIAAKSENPIGLFGYVLLLDCGLIALARRRGWSSLAILALFGTVFYQAFWIFTRMRAENALLGILVLGLFALVFGFAGWGRARAATDEAPPGRGWLIAEGAGLLAPFGFALYFAARADLGPRLYPVAALILLLSLAAQWIARRHVAGPSPVGERGADVLSSGAAAGAIAVVLVWSWDVVWTPGLVWELVAVCVALAAAFHLFFELDVRAGRPSSVSVLVAETGLLVVLILDAFSSLESPWPWIVGFVLIGAMLVRLSIDPERSFTPIIAAAGVAAGVSGWYLIAADAEGLRAPEIFFGVVLLLGSAFQWLALMRASGPERRSSDIAAAAYPAVVLVGLLFGAQKPALEAPVFLAVSMLLGLLLVLATTRLESGGGYLGGMVLLAVVHTLWTIGDIDVARSTALPVTARHASLWLIVDVTAVMAFALWPSFAPRLARSRTAWRAAALAGPAWFLAMGKMWGERFGHGSGGAVGLLPLLLAAVTLLAAYRGRQVWSSDDPQTRTGHLAWFGAVVLGFAAVAVPLQLEKEWVTVGWALEGLAVTALWKRLDHPGLKYFAAALLAAVTARLLLNPEVLRYHERTGLPVLNWLAYAYLVPAACLISARGILSRTIEMESPPPSPSSAAATSTPPRGEGGTSSASSRTSLPIEVARARPWESALYSRRFPVIASGAAVAAILVVFAWINLTIFDAFSTGSTLTLSVERLPTRDLTLSLAWVVYAVTLLGLGMARDSSALRWLSLGFLVLSIGKVFLYDLGELRDLYRVASLVGLAISLILVSLAYQRFVFRRRESEDAA
jgi:uncharacterized membrane protein